MRKIIDVWSWNFDAEFGELLAAVVAAGPDGVLALDTEFPGFLREEPASAAREIRYQALRENVNLLRPIQLGVAVASSDGSYFGTWSFNLRFDVTVDLHTEASVAFLSAAGMDFPRHAREGIDPALVGRRLAASALVGRHGSQPQWVTFAGFYDFGYLLKLLTGWPLPHDVESFDAVLEAFFPRRNELRDALPRGSLDNLAQSYGIERDGTPHTAGSDAVATMDIFFRLEFGDNRSEYGESHGSHGSRSDSWDNRGYASSEGNHIAFQDNRMWDTSQLADLSSSWNVGSGEFFGSGQGWGSSMTLATQPASNLAYHQQSQMSQIGRLGGPLHAPIQSVNQAINFAAWDDPDEPICAPEMENAQEASWGMSNYSGMTPSNWGVQSRQWQGEEMMGQNTMTMQSNDYIGPWHMPGLMPVHVV